MKITEHRLLGMNDMSKLHFFMERFSARVAANQYMLSLISELIGLKPPFFHRELSSSWHPESNEGKISLDELNSSR
jgi:hypothetical protein